MFFDWLINKIRGLNQQANMNQQYKPADFVFGSIISGTYTNFKHDPNPTILCLGNYLKSNGKWYVHGIQLHAIDYNDLNWLMGLIKNMKASGMITNPRAFYYYLKMNRFTIVKNGYRIYHTEFTNFKTINPGFSNLPQELCAPITDLRDNYLKPVAPINQNIDKEKLKENIQNALNTKKIWK